MKILPEGAAPDDYIQARRVALEKVRLGLNFELSEDFLLDPKLETYTDIMRRTIRHQLRGYLWGEKLRHYEFKAPADWWEAMKDRWFPAWALRRWPVRYRIGEVDIRAIYPELRLSLPEHASTLVMEVMEDIRP